MSEYYERVSINGIWYRVYPDTLKVTVTNHGKYVYGVYDAVDELFNEHVKLQYVSINRMKPIPEKPYRIIHVESDE